ncbi:unnamed protein product, partial [Polarella glacialis]
KGRRGRAPGDEEPTCPAPDVDAGPKQLSHRKVVLAASGAASDEEEYNANGSHPSNQSHPKRSNKMETLQPVGAGKQLDGTSLGSSQTGKLKGKRGSRGSGGGPRLHPAETSPVGGGPAHGRPSVPANSSRPVQKICGGGLEERKVAMNDADSSWDDAGHEAAEPQEQRPKKQSPLPQQKQQ